MTLISTTLNHGYPVMIADILISSTDAADSIRTPTFLTGTGDLLKGLKGSKPYKFNRKLYIINNQLCVALAGSVNQIRRFLNQMYVFFKDVIPTEQELKNYINEYPKEDLTDLSAIILLANHQGLYFSTGIIGQYENLEHDIFQTVIATGSGAKSFINQARTMIPYSSSEMGPHRMTLERAIQENLILLAFCLGHEALTAKTLLERWGAGFEIIAYNKQERKFELLSEFTVLLFYGEYDKNTTKFNHQLISVIKSIYQGDSLVIKSGGYQGVQGVFCALPIIDDAPPNIITNFEYGSRNILLSYLVKDLRFDDKFMFPTVASINDSEGEVVKFTVEGEKLNVLVRGELTKTILDYLINETK